MKNLKKWNVCLLIGAVIGVGSYLNFKAQQQNEELFITTLIEDIEAIAQGESGSGVSCSCGFMWGSGCKADNHGSTCASGTQRCWEYDRNCSK